MRKNSKVTLLLFLVLAFSILAYSVYIFRDVLIKSALDKNSEYNISTVTSDSQGSIYLVLHSRGSIVKFNQEGVLQYDIECEKAGEESFSLFSDIVVDERGNLYALSTTLDYRGIYVESERIMRYTPEGNFDKLLYQIDYEDEERPTRTGNIKTLLVANGSLYFYSISDDQILLNHLNTNNKAVNTQLIAYLPADTYLSEISGLQSGSIVYSTLRGEIHRIDSYGVSEKVYPLDTGEEQGKSLPASVKIDHSGEVYFVDIFSNEIKHFNLDRPLLVETLFSQEKLNEQGTDLSLSVFKNFCVSDYDNILVAMNESVIWIGADGKVKQVFDEIKYPLKKIVFRYFLWFEVLLLIAGFIYLCRFFYVNVMNRRISLLGKQIIVFVPIFIASMLLVSGMVYENFSRELEKEVFQKLLIINNMGQRVIDVDSLSRISEPGDYMNDDYRSLYDSIASVIGKSAGIDEEKVMYNTVYKLEKNGLYVIIDDDNASNIYTPIDIVNDEDFQQAIAGDTICSQSSDEDGSWMYSMGPLFNLDKEVIGVYENGMDMAAFMENKRNVYRDIGKNILLITLVLVMAFFIMTYYLLKSIRILRDGVSEMASGNWGTPVNINTRDEVGDLGHRFNIMSEYIRDYLAEITRLSESYFRFVPQEFLRLLGKKSILDVQLGDQVETEMTVLVMNIRSFFVLSEKMNPQENFNFINSFFRRFGPVVRNNDGMIDDYMGGGLRALFIKNPEEALQAAIEMRSVLEIYNVHRSNCNYEALEIGIGIHRGPLMLGVIGEDERIEGTVFSDNVNLAAVMEKLTEKFGASILVSEDIINALENPDKYYYRKLGKVRVEGKDEAVQLFDVFQGDSAMLKRLKLETRGLFEKAVMLFQKAEFYNARADFIEVIRINRDDEIAKIYFYLCEDYLKSGVPENWNGTLVV